MLMSDKVTSKSIQAAKDRKPVPYAATTAMPMP